jgi:hypothetical protein
MELLRAYLEKHTIRFVLATRIWAKVCEEKQEFLLDISLWIRAFERRFGLHGLITYYPVLITQPSTTRLGRVLHLKRYGICDSFLHKLQHLPARIHVEKRRHAIRSAHALHAYVLSNGRIRRIEDWVSYVDVEHIILSWWDGHTAKFASRFSTRSSHVQKRVEGFLFVPLSHCLS